MEDHKLAKNTGSNTVSGECTDVCNVLYFTSIQSVQQ